MELNVFIFLSLLSFAQCKLTSLSCKQIRQFVDGHNSRRLMVAKGKIPGQPATSDMALMVWDEELYEKASKWASKNTFSHNPDVSVPSGRFNTVDNLLSWPIYGSNFDVGMAPEYWFKEHVNYTFGPLQISDFSKSYHIGHYTQMVWANSIYLGCAVFIQSLEGGWNNFYTVCNYGPAGNYIGQTPYVAGEPSNKLKTYTHKDTNICSGGFRHIPPVSNLYFAAPLDICNLIFLSYMILFCTYLLRTDRTREEQARKKCR